MQINDNLAIVLEVGDKRLYHTPISHEVFKANFKVLAATKTELFGRGMAYAASTGRAVAALTLLDEGRKIAEQRDNEGDAGAGALLMEIRRLSTILAPVATGWDMLPIDSAIATGAIDADDWEAAESVLVFFTSGYALAGKKERKETTEAIAAVADFSVTSLSCAEFMASLKMPAPVATATTQLSSIPV